MTERCSYGYTDFTRDISEQIAAAHHLRYVRLPSGRMLYMIGTVENDADEIADCKTVSAAVRAVAEANAETVKVQDELGALLHAAEAERDNYHSVLRAIEVETQNGGQWTLADVNDFAAQTIGGRAMAPEGHPRKLPGQAETTNVPTCCITGRIAGDSDACGDCDPCVMGTASVPDAVKRLLREKDEWREKYAEAMERYEAERHDHEATIKHWDETLSQHD